MAIRGQGMTNADDNNNAAAGSSDDAGKVVYVLHPNCAVEEY